MDVLRLEAEAVWRGILRESGSMAPALQIKATPGAGSWVISGSEFSRAQRQALEQQQQQQQKKTKT